MSQKRFLKRNQLNEKKTRIEYTKVCNFTQKVLVIRHVKATGTPLQCMLSNILKEEKPIYGFYDTKWWLYTFLCNRA